MTSSQHRAGVEPVSHLRALCRTASMCDMDSAGLSSECQIFIMLSYGNNSSQHPPLRILRIRRTNYCELCDEGLRYVSYHCSCL